MSDVSPEFTGQFAAGAAMDGERDVPDDADRRNLCGTRAAAHGPWCAPFLSRAAQRVPVRGLRRPPRLRQQQPFCPGVGRDFHHPWQRPGDAAQVRPGHFRGRREDTGRGPAAHCCGRRWAARYRRGTYSGRAADRADLRATFLSVHRRAGHRAAARPRPAGRHDLRGLGAAAGQGRERDARYASQSEPWRVRMQHLPARALQRRLVGFGRRRTAVRLLVGRFIIIITAVRLLVGRFIIITAVRLLVGRFIIIGIRPQLAIRLLFAIRRLFASGSPSGSVS